jgi:hypothetical protein
LIAISALLAGLFAVVVGSSFRAVRSIVGEGGVDGRMFMKALRSAVEQDDRSALDALSTGSAFLPSALRAAIESRSEGGRAGLAARAVSIEARDRASRALLPLRFGATLGSVLGLLGALFAYLGPRPESLPLELLERGAMELAILGRAALSLVAGLCVHAYAMQAYVALRRDAGVLLGDLAALCDIVAGLDSEEPAAR